jgi:hypothetical protein
MQIEAGPPGGADDDEKVKAMRRITGAIAAVLTIAGVMAGSAAPASADDRSNKPIIIVAPPIADLTDIYSF